MATSQALPAFSMLSRFVSPPYTAFQTASSPMLRYFSNSLYPAATLSIPAISLNIPGLLTDIWEGVLRAVPKKKTSHMKRRHRQLAGKALKDVKSINSCPACGEPKRLHHLCPTCVAEIRKEWAEAKRQAERQTEGETEEQVEEQIEEQAERQARKAGTY